MTRLEKISRALEPFAWRNIDNRTLEGTAIVNIWRKEVRARTAYRLAALRSAGYVVLPEEATRAMRKAGASRELDIAIAEAVLASGGSIRLWGMPDDDPPVRMFRHRDGSIGAALQYSSSLDAALTLADGEDIEEIKLWNDCGTWFVTFQTLIEGGKYLVTESQLGGSCDAALEFCSVVLRHIAALRARKEMQPEPPVPSPTP